MKTVLFILAFILINLMGIGQSVSNMDKQYGFRDAKFEMPLSSFKSLFEIVPNSNIYESLTENLKMGEYNLYSVNYNFYKSQLSSINIVIKGKSDREGVLKMLQIAYGQGDKYFAGSVRWRGKKVYMSYDQFSSSPGYDFEGAIILIRCKKLEKLEESDKKNQVFRLQKIYTF
jgi:hypothetical protein